MMDNDIKDDVENISDHARGVASRVWYTPQTENNTMDPALAEEFARIIDQYREALIWCGGSADFGEGGQAHEGWKKICEPLLRDGIG